MKKLNARQYVLIITGFLLAISIVSVFLLRGKHTGEYREAITIRDITFQTKLADTDSERAEGLMNVINMPEDEGMLFVYNQESPKRFWMKDTLIPLDMIFIDDDIKLLKCSKMFLPVTQRHVRTIIHPKG